MQSTSNAAAVDKTTDKTAEKTGPAKLSEKLAEKRRALGRGLESLLPGPRVVPTPVSPTLPQSARKDGAPAPDSSGSSSSSSSSFSSSSLSSSSAEFGSGRPGAVVATQAGEGGRAGTPVALLKATTVLDQLQAVASGQTADGETVFLVEIDLIDPNPYQTRREFNEQALAELRDSIAAQGVLQPIVVRPRVEGRFILILGERRLRASKMAGLETIPALVRRLSPQQAAEMTVLENVVREDLNPIEQAHAFKVLSQEFKLTQVQIAQRIGVSRESVANYMRLLRLPGKVMDYVAHGELSFSEARELLALENPEHILELAEEVVIVHPNLEQIGERVRRLNDLPAIPGSEVVTHGAARWVDPNVRAAQLDMERTLGMRVKIKDRNGKGTIVIEYTSVDDYERVTSLLRRGGSR